MSRGGRLLVVTAVAAERDAILAGAGTGPGIDVVAGGVGPAAAAASTARLLAMAGTPYRAVISAGIGGGFGGRIGIGGLAVASHSVAADLGAGDGERFVALDELGFGPVRYAADPAVVEDLCGALPEAVAGPVLTVSTATGSAAGLSALIDRYPDAVAEGMEGFGVATAAAGAGIPFGEVRGVSNAVGPRDRAAWRIGDALAALTEAGRALGKLILTDR